MQPAVPDEAMLHGLLLRPLRKIEQDAQRQHKNSEFYLDLLLHDRAELGSALRSYASLRAIADQSISKRRTDAIRASHLDAMNKAAAAKPPVSALAAAAKAQKAAEAKEAKAAAATANTSTKPNQEKPDKPPKRVPSVPASQKPCFEFRDKGSCAKGAECGYSHDPAVIAQSPRSEKGKGKGKGKGKKGGSKPASEAASSPKPTPPSSPRNKEPCKFFKAGKCQRGEACPFPQFQERRA